MFIGIDSNGEFFALNDIGPVPPTNPAFDERVLVLGWFEDGVILELEDVACAANDNPRLREVA